jgi:hypothetical protein
VATYRDSNSNKAAIFVYDTGDSLTSGSAAARRASFPMGDNMAPNVNSTGWAMYDATLDWLLNGGGGSGGGGGPTANATIGISPASVNYGSVVRGSTANWVVSITNTGPTGAAPLNISSLSFGGTNGGDFSTGTTTPISINQGQSVDVTVAFTPGNIGTRTGELSIAHDGSNTSPVVVSLTGEGTVPPPATLGVSTASLDFGSVTQGESGTATVTLTHTGASGALPILVSGITVGGSNGGDFVVTPPTSFTLNQGQSSTVTITFTPSATGSRSGTLSIAHDGTNASPMTVSLSGQGVQGAPRIALIVGNAGSLGNDSLLVSVLESAGYTVTPVDDNSGSVNTNNYELIVISASVNGNTVGSTFRNANIPVVVMERVILDDMNMATTGGYYTSTNTLDIVNSSHPIMAGHSSSIGSNVQFGRVTAASGADRLARHPGNNGNSNDDVIFVFSSGFAARRVAFPIRETTYGNVNSNGGAIFLDAIEWALG